MTKLDEAKLEYAEALETWADQMEALASESDAIAARYCARLDELQASGEADVEGA